MKGHVATILFTEMVSHGALSHHTKLSWYEEAQATRRGQTGVDTRVGSLS